MRDEIYRDGIVPPAALTWHEEESRFAFQNGEAAFMRNWPYAYALMQDSVELAGRGPLRRRTDAGRARAAGRPRRSAAPSSRSTPTATTPRRPRR